MESQLTEDVKKLIEEVAKNSGFREYVQSVEPASSKAGGYSGKILRVTLKNDQKQFSFILKLAHRNNGLRKHPFIREIYLKEMHIYEKVFDTFDGFQETTTDKLNHPKFLGKCDKKLDEAIALENLMPQGYMLWDRQKPMDSNHISLVMAEYGKLHSVSLAIKKKYPDLFSQVVSSHLALPARLENVEYFVSSVSKIIPNIIKGNKQLEDGFKRLVDGAEQLFLRDLRQTPENMVIRHGDCWCNNMMFKYEDSESTSTPTKVCLIDWQLSEVGLPIMDLVYFLFSSSSKEKLYEYDKFLKIYHQSLSKNLTSMACDAEEIFPYSSLEEQWKKCAKYGLFVAPAILRILNVDDENAPVLGEDLKSFEDLHKHMEKVGNNEITKRRIKDIFEFMIEHGLV